MGWEEPECRSPLGNGTKPPRRPTIDFGMEDVKNKRCEFAGCMKRRLFGFRGEKARFCSAHRQEGMVDLKNKRCEWIGCTKQANLSGRGKFVTYFCEEHRSSGMVDIKGARCDAAGCSKIARFGVRGGEPTACVLHREPHMFKIKKGRPDHSCMDANACKIGDEGRAADADAFRRDRPKDMAPLSSQGRGVAVGGLDNVGNHGISNSGVITGMNHTKLEVGGSDNVGNHGISSIGVITGMHHTKLEVNGGLNNVGNHGISHGGVITGMNHTKLEDYRGNDGGNIINGIIGSSSSSSSNGYGSAPPFCPPPTSTYFQPSAKPEFLRCADGSTAESSSSQQPCGENINGVQSLPSPRLGQGPPFLGSSIGGCGPSSWAPSPQSANEYCSSSSSSSSCDGPSCQFPRSSPHNHQHQQSSFAMTDFLSERRCHPPAMNVDNCGGGDGCGNIGFEVRGLSFTEGGSSRYPGFGEQHCLEVGGVAATEEEYGRIPEFLPLQADRLQGTPGERLDTPSEIPEMEPADVWLGDLMRVAMAQKKENAMAPQPKHEMPLVTSGGMSYPSGAQKQFFLSHLSGVGSISYFLPRHREAAKPTPPITSTTRATANWLAYHPLQHKQRNQQLAVPPSNNVSWVKDAGSAVVGESATTALYPSPNTKGRLPSTAKASTGVSPLRGSAITSGDALPQGDCRRTAVSCESRTANGGGGGGGLSSNSNGGPPSVQAGARGPHGHPVAGVFPGDMAGIKTEASHHSSPQPGVSSLWSSTHESTF